jgi:SpoIVB peptidase S55
VRRNFISSLLLFSITLYSSAFGSSQPVNAPLIALDDLHPGQHGEVWTVFRGTEAEPFAVEVTGVVRNALGPGKSLILCELTDPRVQKMGAVAGMSGSPLYIDGKLAGALSYQIQRFETVHYAGFTPAADLVEVQDKTGSDTRATATVAPVAIGESTYQSLQPAFTLSGLSPAVADLFASRFSALGLSTMALGGSSDSSSNSKAKFSNAPLAPGSAVSVALATGDITLAGTGTVSRMDGNRVTAFGHPMLSLGEVTLPMCAAEIVTILPSTMQSIKVANTGPVIGTIMQDRLSAVSGTLGAGPEMIDVEVAVKTQGAAARTLHFAVVRQQQLTPALVAAGVTQAILGSNDAGLANGFRLSSNVTFSASQTFSSQTLYAGPQGFTQGIGDFVRDLSSDLQNPYEKTFPSHVAFKVEALEQNPAITLELFQLSRSTVRAGENVQATLAWRDWQGDTHRDVISLPIDPAWAGRSLEVVLAPGRTLDELTGHARLISPSELRSFNAYLAAVHDDRVADGLCLAILEKSSLFTDQTVSTPDAPGSIERIARAADEARFHKQDALLSLWERHLLPGKLTSSVIRRSLTIVE